MNWLSHNLLQFFHSQTNATWTSTISTFLLFMVALVVYVTDTLSKRSRAVRSQAEQVSAWVEKEIEKKEPKAVIALLNQSNNPVYHTVVTVVRFQGGWSSDGRRVPWEYQSHLSVLPPGKSYTLVCGDYHGAGFHPALEIAFTDQSLRHWLRHGEGKLEQIRVSPEKHYGLDLPLGWRSPSSEPDS